MVSLDDAVLARLEKGGSRYEILVDPDLVDPASRDITKDTHLDTLFSRF